MLGYTWIQWLFFFFFYSFFGWCFESTYVSLHEKRFVNRGFIRGPFLPLYGTGALMMLIVSMPFQDNLILTYVAGCVGATVLEYITGVLMETLFKVRYWDYSDKKFNINGYICLGSSIAWGFLTIFAYHAFYRSDPTAFPMTLQATVNYTWIQQAFLAMFASWVLDGDILEEITSGSISYSLCRPVDLYAMWYTKSLSGRISKVALRAVPVLAVAALLPAGYNLTAPTDLPTFFLFLLTMVLGALNSTAFTLLIYVLTMYTLSSTGLRSLLLTLADFLCGGVVPLPFFPPTLRRICELTPFAATSNVPYRVYSGDIAGTNAAFAVGLQIFWLLVLVLGGHTLMKNALKRVVIQGG